MSELGESDGKYHINVSFTRNIVSFEKNYSTELIFIMSRSNVSLSIALAFNRLR